MVEPSLNADLQILEITDYEVERRKKFAGLGADDVAKIAEVRDIVLKDVDRLTSVFFDYLGKIEEAGELFRRRAALDEARQLKREHLHAMVEGDYGRRYVEQRIRLGLLYSRANLDGRAFLGAFRHLIAAIGDAIMAQPGQEPQAAFARFRSLNKVATFDIGVILDVMIAERERTIRLQQEAIRELSTPALQIRDRLLILPIIGLLDSDRAKRLTDGLLHAIRANRAKVVVVDITGVGTVDSRVANHLLQTVAASRLMGATVIVTGLSANVAQTLVTLGVDLGKLNTVGDLQGGLEEAERLLGYRVVPLADGDRSASITA